MLCLAGWAAAVASKAAVTIVAENLDAANKAAVSRARAAYLGIFFSFLLSFPPNSNSFLVVVVLGSGLPKASLGIGSGSRCEELVEGCMTS